MPKLNVVIIEDNMHDAGNLAGMLKLHFPEIKLLTVLKTYTAAVKELPVLKPDLIFLDINLPGNYTAFDILKSCEPIQFNIIFTTAFDKYAIDAIKASALDYLLKPFDLATLSVSLKRALAKINSGTANNDLSSKLGQAQQRISGYNKKIMIHAAGNIIFINPEDIIRIEASGAYSIFILGNGQKITTSRSLQLYEDELDKEHFFRTHRSFLININKVKSLKRNNNGGMLTLSDDMEVNITKEKLDLFLKMFKEQ